MSEIKEIITEQLQRLQTLMHRTLFQRGMNGGRTRNPHRGQGRVLAILKIKPEISQKELTYLLGMSKQALAELLTKLEKIGYITRQPSVEDKRAMIIQLTEEGAKAAKTIDENEPEAAKVLDCLSDEELEVFSGYLERIIKSCEEQFPDEDFEQRHRAMEEFMLRHRDRSFYDRPGGPSGGFHNEPGGRESERYRRRPGDRENNATRLF